MVMELINANPVVHEKKERRVRQAPETIDENAAEPIDQLEIFDHIRDIKDPEHPYSLEQLNVVTEDSIELNDESNHVRVTFTPTVEHCSMATIIGLCIRVKLVRSLPPRYKVDIRVAPGSHATEAAVNKQLNDKERVAAALENPNLLGMRFPWSFHSKAGFQINSYRTRTVKTKAKADSGDGYTRLAPLRFESPSGQLLIQILQSHPHLLPATVDQQLENLQSEKDAQKEEAAKVPQDLLYKRIAEIKEKERQNALEEIIYCSIIYKFMENDIDMTPALSPGGGPVGDISSLPNQEDKLQSIHSPDAFEMIQNHLNLIMGEKIAAPLDTVVEISNLNLGKLYAASIMYGYFLKRVDERFQLEKTMKTLPPNPKQQIVFENLKPSPFWDMESLVQITPDGEETSLDDKESNPNKLRYYVSQLDADTLQRYATIRSKEAVSLIEKQTQALFGRPDIKVLDDGSVNANDGKTIRITFTELNHLVLEAVAFGSFLWEAESYVESKYHFVNS